MSQIGMAAKAAITRSVDGLLKDYLKDIDEAYALAEDSLDLAIKVKITPTKEIGGIDIQSDLSFIKGVKLKDSRRVNVDENQKELFGEAT